MYICYCYCMSILDAFKNRRRREEEEEEEEQKKVT